MTINLKQARDLVRRIVEERGRDFVYRPIVCYSNNGAAYDFCHYEPRPELFAENDPRSTSGCLVGEVLTLHGETRHLGFSGAVSELFETYPDMMTEEAMNYLSYVQLRQDRSASWGESYDYAEEQLGTGGI